MKALLVELSAAPGLVERIADTLRAEIGRLDRRQFPDGETYLRYEMPVAGRHIALLCTLDHPDAKLAPLLFAAAAARAQGAKSVGLIAPYLGYMRQDTQFHPGEAVTSREFAALLSSSVDWLATVDPHLHRYHSLSEIYSVQAAAGTAADEIAGWIRANVDQPLIIGPDEESRQWVDRIAARAGAHSAVLRKTRSSDYSVKIDFDGLGHLDRGTPVLVDDIASSARTLIEAVRLVQQHASKPPVCAVVHAIFAGDSYARLMESGVATVVSTNTVAHESNAIDISAPLADAVLSVAQVARGDVRPGSPDFTPSGD